MSEDRLLSAIDRSDYVPVSVPNLSGREWDYVKSCLDTGWVSSAGPFVLRFEEDFSRQLRIPKAVAVASGTASLHLAMLASGIQPGEGVIAPTLTFIAPINAISYVGAQPFFFDCDDYLNLDPAAVEMFLENDCDFDGEVVIHKKSQVRMRAILAVHIFGHPANIEPLLACAKKFRLSLIEDSAEALGSIYHGGMLDGKHTGTVGDIGCFSFNGNKIITCGGGGMLVAHDPKLLKHAKYLSTQAKDNAEAFIHNEIGYNYRLTNIQAAIGCAQLEQLEHYVQIKRSNFYRYQELLRDIDGLSLITEPSYAVSNYWFYSLVVDPRRFPMNASELRNRLQSLNIGTRFIWQLNHLQKPFQNCYSSSITKAVDYHQNTLNLPCSTSLQNDDIDRIADAIRRFSK